MAVLAEPMILLKSALSPKALLLSPSVLKSSELAPTELLNSPVELVNSANVPHAGVVRPVVLLKSAASANGRFFIRGVEQERPGADTCVEVSRTVDLAAHKNQMLSYK